MARKKSKKVQSEILDLVLQHTETVAGLSFIQVPYITEILLGLKADFENPPMCDVLADYVLENAVPLSQLYDEEGVEFNEDMREQFEDTDVILLGKDGSDIGAEKLVRVLRDIQEKSNVIEDAVELFRLFQIPADGVITRERLVKALYETKCDFATGSNDKLNSHIVTNMMRVANGLEPLLDGESDGVKTEELKVDLNSFVDLMQNISNL